MHILFSRNYTFSLKNRKHCLELASRLVLYYTTCKYAGSENPQAMSIQGLYITMGMITFLIEFASDFESFGYNIML